MQPQAQNQPNQGPPQPPSGLPANEATKPSPPVAQSSAPQQLSTATMPQPAINTVSPGETPNAMPQPAVNTVSPASQAVPANTPSTQDQSPSIEATTTENTPSAFSPEKVAAPAVQLKPNLVQPSTVVQPGSASPSSDTNKAQAQTQQQPGQGQNEAKQATRPTKEVNATDTFMIGLVYLQFFTLFIILVGFFPGPLFFNTFAMVSGALLMGAGLFLGIWAVISFRQKISPNPKPLKHSFLVTGGPYKYMRHPMYGAIILVAVGLTLVYPTIIRVIAVLILILVIISKMNIEEYLLAKRYHHYARYQRITGKMIPKFKKPDIDLDIDLPNFER